MYFKDVELFDINGNVKNLNQIYAHTKGEHKEKLTEHMELVYEYFLKICEAKKLDSIFIRFKKSFTKDYGEEAVKLWKDMLCNTIYMHDLGKINGDFQHRRLSNEKYSHVQQIDSKHSMLSACIYFDYYFNKLKDYKGEALKSLLAFLFINSYIISRHHGSLDDFSVFYKTLSEKFEFYLEKDFLYADYEKALTTPVNKIKDFWDICSSKLISYDKEDSWNSIDIFIYARFLFSLLTACDFYATSHYQSDNSIKSFGILEDVNKFYDIFKNGSIYKGIRKYEDYLKGETANPFKEGDINQLRSEMFLEAEDNLSKNFEENIFYLEAPTGAGKTNTSVNLAFRLLEHNKALNKIFYIFPFNTLVEQTKKSLDDIFEGSEEIRKEIAVVNSITPIQVDDIEEDSNKVLERGTGRRINYEKALLDRQFLHYPIVLTTHVSFFAHLFGVSREEVFTLAHMANSVVILDEIQSYKNNIWKEIIIFLNKYAKVLNIRIIIMSATLPRLEQLVNANQSFIQLIKNRTKYFENPLFRDRVELDFSLLDIKDNVEEALMRMVIKSAKELQGNILVEFISKSRALEFYKKLQNFKCAEELNKKVMLITGDDNKAERNKIIKQVKSENNIVLVATQVIEAGVDIDMDMGFKDISILDAEEQFLGRINRSCRKKGSKVYFFNLDDAAVVYRGDYRREKSVTLLQDDMRKLLKTKDFQSFYEIIMSRIEKDLNRYNSKNINCFRKEVVQKLDFKEIEERMKLIEEKQEYTVFLNRKIKLEDGTMAVGSKVWKDYSELLMDSQMPYAEKKVKLSSAQELMDYFTYNIDKLDVSYNDVIGNIFYIADGEQYFTEGKFDRKLLKDSKRCDIL